MIFSEKIKILFQRATIIIAFLIIANHAVADQKKYALIIGNSEYKELGILPNPINDADLISKKLLDLDFDVTLVKNADALQLRNQIRLFSQKSSQAKISIFYYAGHAVQLDGYNYILPTDFPVPQIESDIPLGSLKLDEILASIHSETKIVFLDACRDNPSISKRLKKNQRGLENTVGLAPVKNSISNDANNVFIGYATAAGKTASDGNDINSPFTSALTKYLDQNISIDDFFAYVTKEVLQKTNNEQRPYKYASLENIICLSCQDGIDSPINKNSPKIEDRKQKNLVNDGAWVLFGRDANNSFYFYDKNSIEKDRENSNRTNAVYYIYNKNEPSKITYNNVSIDCKNSRYLVFHGKTEVASQLVTNSEFFMPLISSKYEAIPSGSIAAGVKTLVCKQKVDEKLFNEKVYGNEKDHSWIAYGSDSQAVFYYDYLSIHQANVNSVSLIIKYENRSEVRSLSKIEKEEYKDNFMALLYAISNSVRSALTINCSDNTISEGNASFFNQNFELIAEATPENPILYTRIDKNSSFDNLIEYTCSKFGIPRLMKN